MDNLITYDVFEGTIALEVTRDEVQEMLDFHITEVQEKILRSLLGDDLYFDMEENIDESKYQTLIDGDDAIYEYNGTKAKYTGLKQMIAYFTYYYYSRSEVSSNTSMGETMSTSQNGTPVINDMKLINAWNKGIKLFNEAINYIEYKGDSVYADFDSTELKELNSFGI